MQIQYRSDVLISVEQMIDLYNRSTLGERRPVHRKDIFSKMKDNADVIITAWVGNELVGIARTLTDFTYIAYLADLAVDETWQHKGIGRKLIEETQKQLDPTCHIVLFASPKAHAYYPKIGFTANTRGWSKPGPEKP